MLKLSTFFSGHNEVVKYLIEMGANVNVEDEYKQTPFSLASKNRNSSKMKYFQKILKVCHFPGHTEVIQTLIENGANTNVKDGSKHVLFSLV